MNSGKFITFEGVEGSGKSTQIKLAVDFLKEKGFPVILIREPGTTVIGEEIRKILLNLKHKEIDNYCELFLFSASRAQLIREIIKPALAKGKIVISDRFLDATFCYQGYGSGISLEFIKKVNSFIELIPDLTILLDIDAQKGLERAEGNDRFEQISLSYHKRIRKGYLKLASAEPERIKVVKVDGIEDTACKIRKLLEKTLKYFS